MPTGSTGDSSSTVPCVLTINGGSSSIKFALYRWTGSPVLLLAGSIDRIGLAGTSLTSHGAGAPAATEPVPSGGHGDAARWLIQWLRKHLAGAHLGGVGHRVVHGGTRLFEHQRVTPAVLDALREAQPLDLAHLPREIALIEAFTAGYPDIPQVACFDTAFHHDLPRVAQLLPIPRRYFEAGIRRFGFHGLSYTYLLGALGRVAGSVAANGRVILAHLGSGASLAAVKDHKPFDTTMAFTPTAGLVMATRPGDLDPGLLVHLMRTEQLSPEQMDTAINHEYGLAGLSEGSPDMRDLDARSATDVRAADAVDVFCYQARKWVGAYAAAMGGLDTLVFSAGIGEHAPQVRARICDGLQFLGLYVDGQRNLHNAPVISTADSRVCVRVIPTDEESVIATEVARVIGL
jgi:acetate kinase